MPAPDIDQAFAGGIQKSLICLLSVVVVANADLPLMLAIRSYAPLQRLAPAPCTCRCSRVTPTGAGAGAEDFAVAGALRGELRERRVLNFDSAFARSSSIRFLTASRSAPSADTNVCASLSPCSKGVSDMLPIGFLSSVDSNHSAFCNNNHDGPWEKHNYCMRKKYNFHRR